MSDLYLRGVEFSNFRIYGDSYAFEFPDGPGITIITGGNGLGKTSFFDGVEWGLTNQVGRFNEFPSDGRRKTADPLTRIGATEKSHRVSLHFSDGSVIDRGADFDAEEKKILELLKRPEWAEIAKGVRAMVVPGSGAVKAQAEAEGIARQLLEAGFEWRLPGCSMCLAMNDDILEDGVRCASTTNRNFEGRQGRGAITHLMSPGMAAAAAVSGFITDVRNLGKRND